MSERVETLPSGTVLLVDGHATVRLMVCKALRGAGLNVIEARDGAEALQIHKLYHGRVSLLLAEVVMPRMDGCELARKLEAIQPGLRTLYMSDSSPDVLKTHGLSVPEQCYLAKPFTVDGLLRKVRASLTG
jgi:two-component system, cell cycle sensor histidine kinase and response regulator CckA